MLMEDDAFEAKRQTRYENDWKTEPQLARQYRHDRDQPAKGQQYEDEGRIGARRSTP